MRSQLLGAKAAIDSSAVAVYPHLIQEARDLMNPMERRLLLSVIGLFIAGWNSGWQKAHAAASISICDEASLRQALISGGPVTFGCDGTINVASPIVIATNTDLDAAGRQVQLTGGGVSSLFTVTQGAKFTLRGLVLTDGLGGNGGAISGEGTLELIRCSFSNNTAYSKGGAVHHFGTLLIQDCNFTANRVLPSGGSSGGAVYSVGPLTIRGSFFGSNRCVGASSFAGDFAFGGAIDSHASVADTLDVANSTFYGNRCEGGNGHLTPSVGGPAFGGAIYCDQASVVHCTFAANVVVPGLGVAGFCGPFPCGGPGEFGGSSIFSGGSVTIENNIFGDPVTGTQLRGNIHGTTNLIGGAELQLSSPANNGGPTPTIALLPGSVAIDAVDSPNCLPSDQRGVSRPVGDRCDFGAFEWIPDAFRFTSIRLVDGSFELRGVGPPGKEFILYGTDRLPNWQTIERGTVPLNAVFRLVQPQSGQQFFYRMASPPQP